MSDAVQPNPMRRWFLLILAVVLILSAATGLYFDFAQSNPPHWVRLTTPLNAIILAVVWLSLSQVPAVWRRGVAAVFLLMAVIELYLFFAKGL